MNNKPLVSIIIPVYKVEEYLENCVNSILFQDYPNLEIILIDDGSPDSCPGICDDLARKYNNIVVCHIKNGGLSNARNVGLSLSHGELIMFVDSDDYWSKSNKGCLSTIINEFFSDPQIHYDFIIYNYSQYYQLDNITRPTLNYPKLKDKEDILRWFSSTGHYPMMAWNKIIRKEFLINNNINFISGIQSEDIPWFADMLVRCSNFAICNTNLYVYRRQVTNAITKGFSFKKLDNLIFATEYLEKAIKMADNELLKNTYRSFIAYEYVICLHLYPSIPDEDKLKYRQWFIKHRHYLKGAKSKKERMAKMALSILGFDMTAKLLRIYVHKVVTR